MWSKLTAGNVVRMSSNRLALVRRFSCAVYRPSMLTVGPVYPVAASCMHSPSQPAQSV